MGQWNSIMDFHAKLDGDSNFLKTLVGANSNELGREYLLYIEEEDDSLWIEYEEHDFKHGISFKFSLDPGADPDLLEDFAKELCFSVLAMYPDCKADAYCYDNYSVSFEPFEFCFEVNRGELKIERYFFDLDKAPATWNDDGYRKYMVDYGKYCYKYPNFTLNWNAEGLYSVIRAAIDANEAERVESAVKKQIIKKELLTQTVDVAISKQDVEVSALLLNWISLC